MSVSTAQTALFTAAISALGSIPTAFENVPFTKPVNAKWAALFFLPNRPGVETLGSVGQDMVTGIMQIDINYPQDTGDSAARADFETIRVAFKAGYSFTSSGQVVTITNCGRSAGRLVDQFYRVSTTVSWWAMIPR